MCHSSSLLIFFQIHTSLINGRPSADDPSPTLLNFTSARYIRLWFQRIRTLNADLMTLALNDPRDIDPIVTRRVSASGGAGKARALVWEGECVVIASHTPSVCVDGWS